MYIRRQDSLPKKFGKGLVWFIAILLILALSLVAWSHVERGFKYVGRGIKSFWNGAFSKDTDSEKNKEEGKKTSSAPAPVASAPPVDAPTEIEAEAFALSEESRKKIAIEKEKAEQEEKIVATDPFAAQVSAVDKISPTVPAVTGVASNRAQGQHYVAPSVSPSSTSTSSNSVQTDADGKRSGKKVMDVLLRSATGDYIPMVRTVNYRWSPASEAEPTEDDLILRFNQEMTKSGRQERIVRLLNEEEKSELHARGKGQSVGGDGIDRSSDRAYQGNVNDRVYRDRAPSRYPSRSAQPGWHIPGSWESYPYNRRDLPRRY